MRVLVTGVTGQDGSYLAEHLAAAGHDVSGLIRSRHHPRRAWIHQLVPGIRLVEGDLLDQASLERVLADVAPERIYNLAAVTSPGSRWGSVQSPLLAEVTGLGVVRLLDAALRAVPDARIVHASSSAVYDPHRYGLYGVAKRFAHDAVAGYRHGHGMHVSNAVFYSHTSPRQPETFLIRRIARHAADVAAGRPTTLRLTNLVNRRDWGYAPDYVTALPLIADQPQPGDYDICTGITRTVQDVVAAAAAAAGVSWEQVSAGWDELESDPGEHEHPGDLAATRRVLDWTPVTSFAAMVEALVYAEVMR